MDNFRGDEIYSVTISYRAELHRLRDFRRLASRIRIIEEDFHQPPMLLWGICHAKIMTRDEGQSAVFPDTVYLAVTGGIS